MKKIFILFFIVGCLISCGPFDWSAFNQGMMNTSNMILNMMQYDQLSGGIVIAEDGTYLGKITNRYDIESIFNGYGNYGSPYSSKSIWNKYSTYGGEFSSFSPLNQYTNTPPKIYKNGIFIGYLSVNKYLANSFNPYTLSSYF